MPPDFVEDLFGELHPGLFCYTGSLTTPPCTEGVRWFVRQVPATFSAAQIAAFTAVYDHNNRPVQSRYGRSVYFDADPELTVEQDRHTAASESHRPPPAGPSSPSKETATRVCRSF